MKIIKSGFLILLILLNLMVLVGQIWPEAVPPFARTVNIVFLILTMGYFLVLLLRKRKQ